MNKKLSKERPLAGYRRDLGPARTPVVIGTAVEMLRNRAETSTVPALKDQPQAVRVFLVQKPEQYQEGANGLIKVHGSLDAPTPDDNQRKKLNVPLAAGAITVAAEQARQLQSSYASAVAAASPVKADALVAVCGKHDCLYGAAETTRKIVQGAMDGRMVAGGVRAILRQAAFSWYERAKVEAKPGSDRYLDLVSTFETPILLRDKVLQRQTGQVHTDHQNHNQAMQRLDSAKADLQLAQVLSDLRQGKEVSVEDRLAAARHLREQNAKNGAADATAAPATPATPLAGGKKRKVPRAGKPAKGGGGSILH